MAKDPAGSQADWKADTSRRRSVIPASSHKAVTGRPGEDVGEAFTRDTGRALIVSGESA